MSKTTQVLFFDRIEARARAIDSLLCVGLDPHKGDLTPDDADAAEAFCKRIIDATAAVAVAFKPNAAFFERHGAPGFEALRRVIAHVPSGIPVILDAKRGDITSTAEAYAEAAFKRLGADAVTLSPYLGLDGVRPFLTTDARGAFVLCRTSNDAAATMQDVSVLHPFGVRRYYEYVAMMASTWGMPGQVGLVVGATQADALAEVRAVAPDMWILAPGVGAQGADLTAALRAGLREDGSGLLISVSRGISRARDPGAAARELCEEVRRARDAVVAGEHGLHEFADTRAALALGLFDAGCVKLGTYTLKSGLESPIYLDLRRLVAHPRYLFAVARQFTQIIAHLSFDHIAALPYAGLPIGTAVSLVGGWSLIYPRREAKVYGTKATVEGVFKRGDVAVVFDDLATTGATKLEAIARLEEVGIEVRDIVVLVDRQSGAREELEAQGFRFHALFTLRELVAFGAAEGLVSTEDVARVEAFLTANEKAP